LINKGILKDNIKSAIFNVTKYNERISREQFISIMRNEPLLLSKETATVIAVHCINKKESVKEVIANMVALVPDYVILKKSKDEGKKNDKLSEVEKGLVDSDQLQSISKDNNDSEEINIDEEKIIEIVQNFFSKLAKKLQETKTSLTELYGEKLKKVKIGGETTEILSPEDFFLGLKNFDIKVSDPIEYACLIKILAVNDNEKLIKFEYLTEILNDYTQEFNNETLDFSTIDDISLVIILVLSERLVKGDKSLLEFLGEKVYTQTVQIDSQRGSVELIESKDFFKLIESIGITLEEKEHENLKEFLSIDLSYKDKLSVSKIEKAVKEFLSNESLQKKAVKCYEKMAKAFGEESLHDYYKYYNINLIEKGSI